MANGHEGFMPVRSDLLRETLVERIFAQVQERRADPPPKAIAAVLQTQEQRLSDDDDEAIAGDLRHAGYLTRVVEVELFEPARRPAEWIPDMLRERFARAQSWPQALAGACGDLARSEPLEKPSPDDEAATSWRIPGPGGHVRHFVARRTIEEYLQGRDRPLTGDPAELKRPWLYGFFVRACEEALPPGAALDGAAGAT